MNVTRYRAGDRRYLVVDAEQYVPDRETFAARCCDPERGVAPQAAGASRGADHADQGITGPRGGSGVAADGGDAGHEDHPVGADGVLFLAAEPGFRPPRVVMTVVRPDGARPTCCPDGVRCAARWTAARTGADRVMVDTQDGTREARVHGDGSVSAEVRPADEPADGPGVERGPVAREFETDVAVPGP